MDPKTLRKSEISQVVFEVGAAVAKTLRKTEILRVRQQRAGDSNPLTWLEFGGLTGARRWGKSGDRWAAWVALGEGILVLTAAASLPGDYTLSTSSHSEPLLEKLVLEAENGAARQYDCPVPGRPYMLFTVCGRRLIRH